MQMNFQDNIQAFQNEIKARSGFDPGPLRCAGQIHRTDIYRRGYGRDLVYTNNSINSISKRIESAVYRVVADGLFNAHVRCQK